MNEFLKKMFSVQNKSIIRSNVQKTTENYEDRNKSVEAYISIGNLILAIRYLSEWESEVVKLIRTIDGKRPEPFSSQFLDLCSKNELFSTLGNGELTRNLDFLERLMQEIRMSRNAFLSKEEFKGFEKAVDLLHSPLQERGLYTADDGFFDFYKHDINDMKKYQFYLSKHVVFLSYFCKPFSSKLQAALITEMSRPRDPDEKSWIIVDNDIFDCITESPAVKSFIFDVKNNRLNEEYFRDLIYPLLPPQ
jgi:hypothetical protein